jgi:hypothetical protein
MGTGCVAKRNNNTGKGRRALALLSSADGVLPGPPPPHSVQMEAPLDLSGGVFLRSRCSLAIRRVAAQKPRRRALRRTANGARAWHHAQRSHGGQASEVDHASVTPETPMATWKNATAKHGATLHINIELVQAIWRDPGKLTTIRFGTGEELFIQEDPNKFLEGPTFWQSS